MDEKQKIQIGYHYIINKLMPNSPYGKELVKQIKPYTINEKQELLQELCNVEILVNAWKKNKELILQLEHNLMKYKDIKNTICELEKQNIVLDEVALFEIKLFLLNLEETINLYKKMPQLKGLKLVAMTKTLDILDIDKKRMASFYISELYSEKLAQIRKTKAELEKKIILELNKNFDKAEELKKQRLEMAIKEEEEEFKVCVQLSDKLRIYCKALKDNMDSLGKLDLLIRKAAIAILYNGVCPQIQPDGINECVFEEVRNPEVSDILQKRNKTFTPVSINLKKGTTILTGANMGGKSVALKTFILNVMLFQTGFFVFAKKAVLPIFDYISFVHEDNQSIAKGLSTFGAEIIKLNQIIDNSKKGFSFIVLDEFARGTNPFEGGKIVKAVACYLNKIKAITIMSTHYDNIADSSMDHYQVVGLKNSDFTALKQKIVLEGIEAINLISDEMDYSINKVDTKSQVPKDAFNICKILLLNPEIQNIIEETYKE